MSNIEVDVFLPKFKIETKTELKEVLQKVNSNRCGFFILQEILSISKHECYKLQICHLSTIALQMGINKLFSAGQARLDNLLEGENDLYIDSAVQKAFIEVNEEGTEAAAANGKCICIWYLCYNLVSEISDCH